MTAVPRCSTRSVSRTSSKDDCAPVSCRFVYPERWGPATAHSPPSSALRGLPPARRCCCSSCGGWTAALRRRSWRSVRSVPAPIRSWARCSSGICRRASPSAVQTRIRGAPCGMPPPLSSGCATARVAPYAHPITGCFRRDRHGRPSTGSRVRRQCGGSSSTRGRTSPCMRATSAWSAWSAAATARWRPRSRPGTTTPTAMFAWPTAGSLR